MPTQAGEVTIPAVSAAAGVTRATCDNHFVSGPEAARLAMLDGFAQLLVKDAVDRLADGDSPALSHRKSRSRSSGARPLQ